MSVLSLTELDIANPCESKMTQPSPTKQNDAFVPETTLYELKYGAVLFEKLDYGESGSRF